MAWFSLGSGNGGIRGAANPNGLRDHYAVAHANIAGMDINVNQIFEDDIPLFVDLADSKSNFGYYIPFYRDTNDGHCVTVPGFEDVSIGEALVLPEIADMDRRDYVEELLDDDACRDAVCERLSEDDRLEQGCP